MLQRRDEPDHANERSEKVFYGDYSYELAKERMDASIRTAEYDQLAKQLRSARKASRNDGVVARGAALITALFR